MQLRASSALFIGATFILLSACSGNQSAGPSGPNVVPLTVGNCGPGGYINEPCVSVAVCTPGSSNCQTVSNLLLDTGSFGLRVFRSTLGVQTNAITNGGLPLAEMVGYQDGTCDWGQVVHADVVFNNNRASNIPIQLIDAGFEGGAPASTGCTAPDQTPSASGYNGILGVGVFIADCGSNCATTADATSSPSYFLCSGNTCNVTTVPTQYQVSNPIAFLPGLSNGVALQLPSVSAGGAPTVTGSLLLGIGTASNNAPSGATTFPTDGNGFFNTTFAGQALNQSFIDSGSNDLYFPRGSASISECNISGGGTFYCPGSLINLTATMAGYSNFPTLPVSFQLANGSSLINSSNSVFNDVGVPVSGGSFDWGLPFFLGRTVYVGIEGRQSPLGTGPYWAF